MSRPSQLTFGLLLTGLAGYIDSIGFIRLTGPCSGLTETERLVTPSVVGAEGITCEQ